MRKIVHILLPVMILAALVSAAQAVSQPVIHTQSLPNGVIQKEYSAEIAASADIFTTVSWVVVKGSLPDGLTLDEYDLDGLRDSDGYVHGYIHGKPSKLGTFSFTVQAAAQGYPDLAFTADFSITITEGEASTITTYTTCRLGTAEKGEEFSASLTSLGKYKYFSGGQLPPGLSFSENLSVVDINGNFIAAIEGTPTQAGEYKFFIAASDKSYNGIYSSETNNSWLKECSWKVYPMTLTVNQSAQVQAGSMHNVGISAQSVPSGTVVTYKDFPSLSGGNTPVGVEGEEYTSGQFTSSGRIVGVIDGVLPEGLQYSSSNVISGVPVRAGIYTSIIAAVGYQHLAAARPVTIEIEECSAPEIIAQLPKITTQTLSSGTTGEMYSAEIAFTGAEPVTFSISSGELPEGLSLGTSTGKVSGRPSAAGEYTFTVQAVNSYGRAAREFVLIVEAASAEDYSSPNIELADPIFLTDGTVGEAYSKSVYNLGIDYRFGDSYIYCSGGELPPGLSFTYSDANEIAAIGNTDSAVKTTTLSAIKGTPEQEGVYKFFLVTSTKSVFGTYKAAASTATSFSPAKSSWSSCKWKVYPVIMTINPEGTTSSAQSVQNVGASVTINGTTYTQLPASSFPALGRDSLPQHGIEGAEYTSPEFNSFNSGYISVLDGKLPKGLELQEVTDKAYYYTLSGTPVRAGIYTFILMSESNTYGNEYARVMPVTVEIDECIAPEIPEQALSSGSAGEPYSEKIAFTGSQPALLVVTGGMLPEGLSLDVSGNISGTPERSGNYTFIVEACNFSGRTSRELRIVIEADTDIAVNAENFPDAVFRSYVSNNFDSDSNGYLSEAEAEAAAEMYLNNKGITSLKGIEHFTNLKELYCNNNSLTELDITSSTELETLYCKGNQITRIDIRNCPKLNDFIHDGGVEILDGSSEPEPEAVPEFKTQSLLLSGQIGVNFFMDLPEISGVDYSDKDCWMEFSINGSTKDNNPQPYDPEFMNSSNKYYGFTCFVNSIQMADTITATLHYGNNKTVSRTYSAKRYMDTVLGRADMSAELRALMAAMKDYGHYMQIYLSKANGWTIGTDYTEMDCANVYTDSDITEAAEAVKQYAIKYDKGDSGIQKVTFSLTLDSETAINVYLTPETSSTGDGDTLTPEIGDDIIDYSVSAFLDGGKENVAVKQRDGRYLVKISGVSAHELGRTYTITVKSGGTFDIKVSALSFANAVLKSETMSAAAKHGVTSLYRYYTATMEYRKSKGYKD